MKYIKSRILGAKDFALLYHKGAKKEFRRWKRGKE
jgi:hypothetical protein